MLSGDGINRISYGEKTISADGQPAADPPLESLESRLRRGVEGEGGGGGGRKWSALCAIVSFPRRECVLIMCESAG